MKEEKAKLAKDLESKYSSTLSYRSLNFMVLSSTLPYLINITPCSCEEKCQIAPGEDEERLRRPGASKLGWCKKVRGVVLEMQQAYDGVRNPEQQMQDTHQRARDLEACLHRDGERDRTSARHH
jgi:hypothetical protein